MYVPVTNFDSAPQNYNCHKTINTLALWYHQQRFRSLITRYKPIQLQVYISVATVACHSHGFRCAVLYRPTTSDAQISCHRQFHLLAPIYTSQTHSSRNSYGRTFYCICLSSIFGTSRILNITRDWPQFDFFAVLYIMLSPFYQNLKRCRVVLRRFQTWDSNKHC